MSRSIDKRIRSSRILLENQFAHLNGEGEYDAVVSPPCRKSVLIDRVQLLRGRRKGRAFARKDIEEIVRNLQKELWRHRSEIIESADDIDPLQLLDPMLALSALGYSVDIRDSLGQHSAGKDSFEVAGIVDSSDSTVQISRRFAPAMQRFTAAHELGHAVLHEGAGLHRDRAPDGSSLGTREPREAEADVFASFFLLPEKQVRSAFKRKFLANQFWPSDATAFAIGAGTLRDLLRRCRTERELARMLANAQAYNGIFFNSLADRFGVSSEVMAIRLEELELVKLK
jgi:hypothetical protein